MATQKAYFGLGMGAVILSAVNCDSSDSYLMQCISDPLLDNTCDHSMDAGARCEGKTFSEGNVG